MPEAMPETKSLALPRRDAALFVLWFAGLIAATIGADLLLHRLDLPWVGRWLGPLGSLLIAIGLLPFSLRKRGLTRLGDPARVLGIHQATGWIGALMITAHAGIHFNALLPWLALAALVLALGSGLAGLLLIQRERRHFADLRSALVGQGLTPPEVETQVFWDALALDLTRSWRRAHAALAAILTALALVHIASVTMFWRGL